MSQWVRLLGENETYIEKLNRRDGTYTMVYSLHIASSIRINDDVTNRCIKRLMREIPQLRLRTRCSQSIMRRDFLFELKETMKPDFRRLDNQNWTAVHQQLQKNILHHEEGPLWRLRLMPGGEKENPRSSGRPFSYTIFMQISNTVTDAPGACVILGRFLELVDASLNNSLPSMSYKMHLLQPAHEELVPNGQLVYDGLSDFSTCMKVLWRYVLRRPKALVCKYLPRPDSVDASTGMLHLQLNKKETECLILKCRHERTTTNSALTVIAMSALCRLLSDAGFKDDHPILYTVLVNDRKYIGPLAQFYIGSLSFILDDSLSLADDDIHRFWIKARENRDKIQRKLSSSKDCHALHRTYQHWMAKRWGFLSYFERQKPPAKDMLISNLGPADKYFSSNMKHIEVDGLYQSTNLQGVSNVFSHSIVLVNGRLNWTLSYDTKWAMMATAAKYINYIKDTIDSVVSQPTRIPSFKKKQSVTDTKM